MTGHNLPLPRHRYCFVRASYIDPSGWPYPLHLEQIEALIPCTWWGVSVTPGRMMGCHVLLESGAMVVDLPLSALHAHPTSGAGDPLPFWQASVWDGYGWEAEAFCPPFLEDALVETLTEGHEQTGRFGRLWFAIDHVKDGYAMAPSQHKHLWVVALDSGQFVQLPQDQMLVHDKSFTEIDGVPRVRRQDRIWRAE